MYVRTRCFRMQSVHFKHVRNDGVPSLDLYTKLALAVFQNVSVSQIHLLFLGFKWKHFHLYTRNVQSVQIFCGFFIPLHELQNAL
jgi:hypothetical protein